MAARTLSIDDAERGLIYVALGRGLQAGLPPERALEACNEAVSARAAAALRASAVSLRAGKGLTATLSRQGLLSPLDRAVIESAELAGSVDGALQALGRGYEARHLRRHKLKGKLLLPAFMLVLSMFVGPLPALVAGTITPTTYVLQCAAGIALLVALAYLASRVASHFRAQGRPGALTRTALALPVAGTIVSLQQRVQLFETLGVMLRAGLPALDALQALHASERDGYRKQGLGRAVERARAGASLADALHASGLVDAQADGAILAAAEQAGRLEESLARLAASAGAELDDWYRGLGLWVPALVYLLVCAYIASGML